MDKAIRVLKMAVEEDPEFAEAWAYLAAAACVTWVYQTAIGDDEAIWLADQAAKTALNLDPGMGLALAVQAMLAYGVPGDVQKGFELIDRAAAEYPYDTTIRLWAGMFTHHWGYLEEALYHFRYAFRHNPRAGITNGMLGQVYLEIGRDDLAAPHLAKATELGWPLHVCTQASRHMIRGDIDAAFGLLKVAFADPGTDSDPLPWIHELEEAGRSYLDNPARSDALIAVLERTPREGVWGKLYLSLVFDLRDQFFEHFSMAVRKNHLWTMIMMIVWLPEYRAYVEDPRFLEIMRGDGALALWEHRGFPDGCVRVNDAAGDRLDCLQRYPEPRPSVRAHHEWASGVDPGYTGR
jgi:tetratricopeptide (TPR) repeat protein